MAKMILMKEEERSGFLLADCVAASLMIKVRYGDYVPASTG